MNPDEEHIKGLFSFLGCRTERFPDTSPKTRTPDFKVTFLRDGFVFLCEVKSIENKETEGLRHTRVFNVFTAKIHEAVEQFEAVNPNHLTPNVLAFVSHEMRIDWNSFRDFVRGKIALEKNGQEETLVELRKITDSRIQKEFAQIDLYLLVRGHTPHMFFNPLNQNHFRRLSEIFRSNSSEIPSVSVG